jgi:hypothetical protein
MIRVETGYYIIGESVSYMLGVPSLKALVIAKVRDQYLLHQEYDTVDDNGRKVHVTKEFQRPCYIIDDYWADNLRLSLHSNAPYGNA